MVTPSVFSAPPKQEEKPVVIPKKLEIAEKPVPVIESKPAPVIDIKPVQPPAPVV